MAWTGVWWRPFLLAAGLAVVGVAGAIGLLGNTSTATKEVAARDVASAPASVGALGRIEPGSEVIEVGAAIDDRLASLHIAEGDSVEKDAVLGHLASRAERLAERDHIAAQLHEAERLHAAETRLGEAAIREMELRVRRAAEVTEPSVAAQRARVQSLEVELANSREILAGRERLISSGSTTKRNVDDQRTVVTRNERSLSVEQKELERLRTELSVDGLTARTQLERARAELTRAQASTGVESLRRQLEVAEARVHLAEVTAPIAGQVLKIMIQPGARVASAPILKMGDTREMHAVAEVYETDIGAVKIGQSATIRSRALPKPLSGKVVRVGRMIFKNDVIGVDPAAKVDARIVEVRIRLDEPALAAGLTNLSIDVVIDTAEAAGVAARAKE